MWGYGAGLYARVACISARRIDLLVRGSPCRQEVAVGFSAERRRAARPPSAPTRDSLGKDRPDSLGKDRRIVYEYVARHMLACGMNSRFLRHEFMRITHVDMPDSGMNSCPRRHEFMPRKRHEFMRHE